MDPVGKALWLIESRFSQVILLAEIAAASGGSRFHLLRAYGAATGCTVMGYLRGRRLRGSMTYSNQTKVVSEFKAISDTSLPFGTERLNMRKFGPSDYQSYAAYHSRPDVYRFLCCDPPAGELMNTLPQLILPFVLERIDRNQ
ncbi:AraC family transcriptional regulator [Microvirga guangxiensis]|uniref:HTH araC/xylS-type domain-containing protein n=1 Tax=Microvirga guangxiensis TaxID=549386 RepID=A0A1G5LHQ0_9HYPH|nr:AraC family transcriptional regulator [Microvirga guangxiensis]SCZ12433.1 hypothetical protein SAMN02927923_04344 [Microvirga guangxiensis]